MKIFVNQLKEKNGNFVFKKKVNQSFSVLSKMEAFLLKTKKKQKRPFDEFLNYPLEGKFNFRQFSKQYIQHLKKDFVYFSSREQINEYTTCVETNQNSLCITGNSSGEIKLFNLNLSNAEDFHSRKQKNEILSMQSKKYLSSVKFGRKEGEILVTSRNQSYILIYDINKSNTESIDKLKCSSDINDLKIDNQVIYCGCRDGTVNILGFQLIKLISQTPERKIRKLLLCFLEKVPSTRFFKVVAVNSCILVTF
jgi:WD40 repeat protein